MTHCKHLKIIVIYFEICTHLQTFGSYVTKTKIHSLFVPKLLIKFDFIIFFKKIFKGSYYKIAHIHFVQPSSRDAKGINAQTFFLSLRFFFNFCFDFERDIA